MAVIMGATYPDVFAAVGVHSGLAYKAGTNLAEGLAAQARGGNDPNRMGQLAFAAMGRERRPMRVIVFQGRDDGAVAAVNADQVISQWAQTNDLIDDRRDNNSVSDVPGTTTDGVMPGGGYRYSQSLYFDRAYKSLLEKWIVTGLKHAWSGGSGAAYTDPKGPSASREMWRFFMQGKRKR